ncbi:RagB/SusD family nutrient uptake outer membrane protein [Bacteroides nordii]|uniref:RagB/SusD family nutrient uptake outer membrane protein n=1 Tax=Bacteroides nordii TaxID=291645 RepID=UPI001F1DA06F|nr:RagB/SusD family nutrient uptake outer membrane protein [Bacteroides nordii]MCE8464147.1 RagB/SusD family nutrient uptake outer membrane protein [Bacteroides nordii]UYU49596.1 RagB/SusD family nutrient uptake outer membrane protein [Bacteroides nordii]
MKNMKLKYLLFGLLMFSLAGCDFLNCDESSDYEKEDIFQSYNRTKQMVTHVYSYLPNGFCNISGAMHEAGTDDAVHVYGTSAIQRFVDGTWSANHTVDDVWSNYYAGIRAANLYLKEAEGLTFEDWKFNDNYEAWMKNFGYFQYEVRFLRAFYYFELIKRYQNVPLITEVLTPEEANRVKPSTFEEIANFIMAECEILKNALPVNFKDGFMDKESGRITKGAVLALRSRLTLYLASPLYSADDKNKWKRAAAAAYDIIGQISELGYGLGKYANLFGANNNLEKENILVRPIGESGEFEKANFPMGVQGGKTSTCPTENLVSAYEMTDGTSFDWNNEKMRKSPYVDRDPRLAMTIAYNGMIWPKKKLEIYEGGANGLPLNNATVTGYYLKKFVNSDINFESGSTVTKKHHNWILFRYGEVLLNYAEAMVNAFGSPTYSDSDYPMSAWAAVSMLRGREDVHMPLYPEDLSPEEFMKRLKNERRVELAFEGHRFWDVRRWKDLEETAEIYKVEVKKVNGKLEYNKNLYDTHIVADRMYFYPISASEMFKNDNLVQNPNW